MMGILRKNFNFNVIVQRNNFYDTGYADILISSSILSETTILYRIMIKKKVPMIKSNIQSSQFG